MMKVSNRAIMFKHVVQYQASGQSIVSYCKKHGINPHNFYYWRKVFNSTEDKKPGMQSFIEIPFASTSSSHSVQLRMPQGHSLEFATLPPVDYLRQLLLC